MATFLRRTALKVGGLGLVAPLLSPLARSLVRDAHGAVSADKRAIFWIDLHGVPKPYRPTATPSGEIASMGAYTALEPLKKDILVVDRLYHPFNTFLHGNQWILSVNPSPAGGDRRAPGGQSIDRLIAAQRGKEDPYPSISLKSWPHDRDDIGDYEAGVSSDGASRPFPQFGGANQAWDAIFAKLALPGDSMDASRARLLRDRGVLSFVMDDVSRLQRSLAGTERAKLDQYLESLRGVETRVQKLSVPVTGCGKPARPNVSNAGFRVEGVSVDAKNLPSVIEVTLAAFACRLTKVAVIDIMQNLVEFLGPKVGDHGKQWHDSSDALMRPYFKYLSEQMASIWSGLRVISDGGGTMADSTMLTWINKAGLTHHNGWYDHMVMVLGGAGKLPTNKFVTLPTSVAVANDPRFPQSVEGKTLEELNKLKGRSLPTTCISDFYTTIANAAGVAIPSFGDAKHARGPLPL